MSGSRLSERKTTAGTGGLPDCSGVCLLVAGDLMLDRYFHGAATRISPEAPVPVVRIEGVEERPGGAANVAANITALGAQAALVGLVGADEDGARLRRIVSDCGVDAHFVVCEHDATIVKSRVISCGQQLMRLDFEAGFNGTAADALAREFTRRVGKADAVILSDYAKGCLRCVEELIAAARERDKQVFVDPKGADFSRYKGAGVLTPNMAEFEAVAGHCRTEDEMVEKALAMKDDLGLDALVITRGEHGMTLVTEQGTVHHLPARTHEVYDVTGAGDTVVSVFGATITAGASSLEAAQFANQAAGLVVEKSGTAAVTPDEFSRYGHGAHAIYSEQDLLEHVAAARKRGQRIVMTNGCFDLLHAGHVAFLAQAAALGDRLIVAVNDDDSVAGLKGKGRPITPLERRMRLVAALAMVDWVVPFSEPTPARLIAAVSPDVLVKGGDYKPGQIAGAEHVKRHGGEVIVLDYIEGLSTTGLIDAIRN